MGYGDFTPSGNYTKKPLSKKELKKLREAYSKAGEISQTVKELEEKESKKIEEEMEEMMKRII